MPRVEAITDLIARLNSLNQKLRSFSSKSVETVLAELKTYFNGKISDELKSKVAIKIVDFIVKAVSDGFNNFPVYTEILRLIALNVGTIYEASFAKNLNYYYGSLVVKKFYDEAFTATELLKLGINNCNSEETLETYFSMVLEYNTALLIHSKKLEAENLKNCFSNLNDCLRRAIELNSTDLFVKLLYSSIEKRNCFTELLKKDANATKEYLLELNKTLKQCTESKEKDKMFTTMSKLLVVIMMTEETLYHKTSFGLTLTLAKTLHSLDYSGESSQYALQLIRYLVKIFGEENHDVFNKHFQEILSKFETFLKSSEQTCIIIMDTAVTITELLLIAWQVIVTRFNGLSYKAMLHFQLVLLGILRTVRYDKSFCVKCTGLKYHELWNVARIVTGLIDSAITANAENPDGNYSSFTIIKYVFDFVPEHFKCPLAYDYLHDLCLSIRKFLYKIENRNFAQLGLKFVEYFIEWNEKNPEQKQELLEINRCLIPLLGKFYKLLEKEREYLEIQCISLVFRMSDTSSSKDELMNKAAIINNILDESSDFKVIKFSEILSKCKQHLKIPAFNKFEILKLQFEASLKFQCNEELKNVLLKETFESCKKSLDLAWFVSKSHKYNVNGLKLRISSEIKRTEAIRNPTAATFIILGHLYYRLYLFHLESKKSHHHKDLYTDKGLSSAMITIFKDINIEIEIKNTEIAEKCRLNYEKYFNETNNETEITDWECILDNLSYIARQQNLSGFMDESLKTWMLILNISKEKNFPFFKICAISYLAESCTIADNLRINFNFDEEINDIVPVLIENFKKIETLSPRRQNYVLTCLINLAEYYFYRNDVRKTSLLSQMAIEKVVEIRNTKTGYIELIRAKHIALKYIMARNIESIEVVASLHYADRIHEVLRYLQYVTSEDSVNLPAFLFKIVLNIANFMINRLLSAETKPLLFMMLKFAVESGLSLRTMQVLNLLIRADLQSENFREAESKFILLDVMLNNNKVRTMLNDMETEEQAAAISYKKENLLGVDLFFHQKVEFQQVRKALPKIPLSPKTIKLPVIKHYEKIDCYLLNTNESFEMNNMYKMISFETGCLSARLEYFLNDFINAYHFLEAARKWWRTIKNPYLENVWSNFGVWHLLFYSDASIKIANYGKAREALKNAHDRIEENRNIDPIFKIIVFEKAQSMDFDYNKPQDLHIKRSLNFNSEEFNEKTIQETKTFNLSVMEEIEIEMSSLELNSKTDMDSRLKEILIISDTSDDDNNEDDKQEAEINVQKNTKDKSMELIIPMKFSTDKKLDPKRKPAPVSRKNSRKPEEKTEESLKTTSTNRLKVKPKEISKLSRPSRSTRKKE